MRDTGCLLRRMVVAILRWVVGLVLAMLVASPLLAVPPGYRYIGSSIVTGGRHVYWYWHVEHFEMGIARASFVARLHARNVELGEERGYTGLVRCDSRTYRRADSSDAFEPIEADDPIDAVWRAGCSAGRVANLAARLDQFNRGGSAPAGPQTELMEAAAVASTVPVAVPAPTPPSRDLRGAAGGASGPPRVSASPDAALSTGTRRLLPGSTLPTVTGSTETAATGRAVHCIRFTDSLQGAAILNTCGFDVEIAYCYKGGRGNGYDCPRSARGMRTDTLRAGVATRLPDYSRTINQGLLFVACRGAFGAVIPRLGASDSRGSGCY